MKSARLEVHPFIPSTYGALLAWLPMNAFLTEQIYISVQDPVWSEVFS